GIGVTAVAMIIDALRPKDRQRPVIDQHTQGANSPNIVGNSNVVSYAAEPNERAVPSALPDALKGFAGQRFWIIAQTNDWDAMSEQVRFARAIDSALQAAQWNRTDKIAMKQRGSEDFREVPQPSYMRVSNRGVIVYAAAPA